MKKTILLVLVLARLTSGGLALGLAASVANADFIFGTSINLGSTVNSSAQNAGPSISADGLSLFFVSIRS